MKPVRKFALLIPILIFMTSCLPPSSKEAYLGQFERFVSRVEQNHHNYNKKDWEWAESRFEKYNGEYYLKFRDEFSLEDQIKIKGLILEYYSYRDNKEVGELLRELFREDVDEMREKVEEYIENDMDEDLGKLMEGAAEIGDSALKVLEEVIEKLDNTF